MDLAPEISIFVGANKSGKTSATHAIELFASGNKDRFSLHDFSSHTWSEFDTPEDADPAGDTDARLPTIHLDLWFGIVEADLYLVLPLLPSSLPLLPSSDWQGRPVGVRVELVPRDAPGTLGRFRKARFDTPSRTSSLKDGAGSYVPWPKSLVAFLERDQHAEYQLSYYVLDPAGFDDNLVQRRGYSLAPMPGPLAGDTRHSRRPALIRRRP